MTYLLDTNVFIQAKNLHYGFDFCPGFWDWLTAANDQNRVFSIGGVRSELVAGDDELAEWAGERREKFFLEPDASIVPAPRCSKHLGDERGLRADRGKHISAGRRLLPGGTRLGSRVLCRHP